MTWLASLLAGITEKLLAWVVGLISAAITRWNNLRKANAKVEEANHQVLEETQKAETKEERDNAAKDVIRGL